MRRTPLHVAITGGNGYIGSSLRQALAREEHTVFLLSNSKNLSVKKNEHLIKGGFDSPEFPERIDALVHLFGLSGDRRCEENPKLARQLNVDMTQRVKTWAEQEGIPHVIFASSASVYDSGLGRETPLYTEKSAVFPQATYGRTKIEAEQILRSLVPSSGVTVLRKPTVYGWSPVMRFDTLVHHFVREAHDSKTLSVFAQGNIWRPTLSLPHAIAAYMTALMSPHKGFRIVNVVSENQPVRTYADRIRHIARQKGVRVRLVSVARHNASSYVVQPTTGLWARHSHEVDFNRECLDIWDHLDHDN